ncbi:MAG: metallophosphoesterase family protein [Brevinematia bacterium]
MKILVLSDIHSNLEALISVFNNVETHSIDLILNLGDIVGYGPDPEKCIEFAMERNFISIKGNHERMLFNPLLRRFANDVARFAIEWTDENLRHTYRQFLERLPEIYRYSNEILCVHGSPIDPDEYILRTSTAQRSLQKIKDEGIKICFHGHSHVPGIFNENANFFYEEDKKFYLREGVFLINPGSVGQPRDRNPMASYCIFDETDFSVMFYRVEYNISRTCEKIALANLPPELGMRLWYGI